MSITGIDIVCKIVDMLEEQGEKLSFEHNGELDFNDSEVYDALKKYKLVKK